MEGFRARVLSAGRTQQLVTALGLLFAGSVCFVVGASLATSRSDSGVLQALREYDFFAIWGSSSDDDSAYWGATGDGARGARQYKYSFVVVPSEAESPPHVYLGNDFNVFGHLGIQRKYLFLQPRVWKHTANMAEANLILVSSIHYPRDTPFFDWSELSKPRSKDPRAVGFPRVISHFPPKRAYLPDRVLRAIGVSWMQMFELRSKVRARCFIGLKMDVAKCLAFYARRHPEVNIDLFYPKSFIFIDDPKEFNATAKQFLAFNDALVAKMLKAQQAKENGGGDGIAYAGSSVTAVSPTQDTVGDNAEAGSGAVAQAEPASTNVEKASADASEDDQPGSDADVGVVSYSGDSADDAPEEGAESAEGGDDAQLAARPDSDGAQVSPGGRKLMAAGARAKAPAEVSGVGLTMPRWLVKLGDRGYGGQGIRVFSDTTALLAAAKEGVREGPLVVQRLIDNVMTFRGRRFDLRVYILVTSLSPLTLYINVQGTVVRLAAGDTQRSPEPAPENNEAEEDASDDGVTQRIAPHAAEQADGELDRRKFLTNFSVHHDAEALVTLQELLDYFRSLKLMTLWKERTLPAIKRIARRIFSLWNTHEHRKYSYKLWGIDIMIDGDMRPWYIEANPKPMMFGLTKANFKQQHRVMVADMFKIVFWRHYGQTMQPSGTWEIIPADI